MAELQEKFENMLELLSLCSGFQRTGTFTFTRMTSHTEEGESPFTSFVDASFKNRTWDPPSSPKRGGALPGVTQLEEAVNSGDKKQIKTLIRESDWPPQHPVRSKLWWLICQSTRSGGGSAAQSSVYNDMVTDMFGNEQRVNASLPSFVDPSSMYGLHLSDHGVRVCKKVMCIVGKSRPDVIYAPTLYTLGCLMLHYMEEQQVFDIVECLLTGKARHILQTKVSYEASAYIVKELARKHAKKMFGFLVQQNSKPETVLSEWIWWIFRDLPFTHMVRVIDCYLYEGPKVLYRVVLAILRLFYHNKVKSGARLDSSLNIAISQFCQDMPGISVALLLKTAFKIRGFSRNDLDKVVVKQEMYVTSLINTHGLHTTLMTKSPSCESLNDKVTVSRSFSLQEIGSNLLTAENDTIDGNKLGRVKSLSHGTVYVPFSNTKSSLLTHVHFQTIWGWLPDRVRLLSPELIFSTAEHGTSLNTFYNHVENQEKYPATLLVIKTTENKLLGAYCSADWNERYNDKKALAFFGTGETFVFTLNTQVPPPASGGGSTTMAEGNTGEAGGCKYGWVGLTLREETPRTAQLYMSGDNTMVVIGGGDGGVAIKLDADLNHGETTKCATFNNPALAGQEYFDCATVEVFGFV